MPLVNDQSPTGLHQTVPSVTSMSGERGEYLGRGSDNLGRGRGYAFHSSRGTPRMRSAWGSRGFYRGGGTVFGTRGEHPGRDIMEGLIDKPLKTLRRDDVSDMEDVAITDLEYVASFNWVESDGPTIIVPGSPRIWLDRPLPFTVEPDSGQAFNDTPSLLPLFRALDVMESEREKPKVDWNSIDVVTDRSNLRKLLSWADGNDEGLRIDVQLVGGWTLLLRRWESGPSSPQPWGFGDSFERASTKPAKGCELSILSGHCRIVTYDFAGLKLLLLFEVDAYDPGLCDDAHTERDVAGGLDTMTSLQEALTALSVEPPLPARAAPDGRETLRVIRAGTEIPQRALVKIKTRSRLNIDNLDWGVIYPQLFIGQTPTLKIGVHQRGEFYEVREEKLDAPKREEVARETQTALKKLWTILKELHNLAMAQGKEGRINVVSKGGVLQVVQRESTESFIPEDLLSRFDA